MRGSALIITDCKDDERPTSRRRHGSQRRDLSRGRFPPTLPDPFESLHSTVVQSESIDHSLNFTSFCDCDDNVLVDNITT